MSIKKSSVRLIRWMHGRWILFLLERSGPSVGGRFAAKIASLGTLPFHHRSHFANYCDKGFVAPTAVVANPLISTGKYVYIGDHLMITRNRAGGSVRLADRVHLYGDSCLETGLGGNIHIGQGTHIQPGCRIHAFISDVSIGGHVEIAPNCAFYSYDHGMMVGKPIMDQPLTSKGRIVVGEGAWIGHGVAVLQGVRIGAGAIIGAGAVVIDDIPENAIAVGVPARVVGYRPGVQEDGFSKSDARKISAIVL
jgi:acetyltransferase-like isoleucine patch superfamily enzyme